MSGVAEFNPYNGAVHWHGGHLPAATNIDTWISGGWEISALTDTKDHADRMVGGFVKTRRQGALVMFHSDNGQVFYSTPSGPQHISDWLKQGWSIISLANADAHDRTVAALVK